MMMLYADDNDIAVRHRNPDIITSSSQAILLQKMRLKIPRNLRLDEKGVKSSSR